MQFFKNRVGRVGRLVFLLKNIVITDTYDMPTTPTTPKIPLVRVGMGWYFLTLGSKSYKIYFTDPLFKTFF